jgi:quinol monooxygenase YgiN
MYGTVARLRVKPEATDQLTAVMKEYEDVDVPGFVASYVYRLDGSDNEYMMAVVFEDQDSYRRNAEDPAQDERYRRMRELLESDPEWHDGEIVWSETKR